MPESSIRGTVALLSCLLILVLVNLSIAGKERLLSEGRIVYLELAPVDPRSLMQGDYMALNYRLAAQLSAHLPKQKEPASRLPGLAPGAGRIVAALDQQSVARFVRLDGTEPRALAENEIYLQYRVRNGQLEFASNAFFFQEGTATQYESAHYGQFRVAEDGEMLLAGLFDEQFAELGKQALD